VCGGREGWFRVSTERQFGTVKVEFASKDTAVVALTGEHDLGSRAALRATLASAGEGRNVLVDLSRCTFVDSAIISLLLATQGALKAQEARCELIVPASAGYVARLFEITGVADLFCVHASRNAGFASIAGPAAVAGSRPL
jgi:anti-anti-sigma factor